jgi:RimJ/RimL family protein N-acetyltransferase
MPLPEVSPTIDANKLKLRAFRLEDADDLHGIYSDQITMQYWGIAATHSIEESRKLVLRDLEALGNGQAMLWALELKATGKVVGKCTLWQYSEANQRAEVGYILNREYWRGGLMTDALSAMIDYAFSTLGLHRLEADTDDKNVASLALLEKLGFKREGFFRERWYVNETWQHSVMLGLLKQEWRGATPA